MTRSRTSQIGPSAGSAALRQPDVHNSRCGTRQRCNRRSPSRLICASAWVHRMPSVQHRRVARCSEDQGWIAQSAPGLVSRRRSVGCVPGTGILGAVGDSHLACGSLSDSQGNALPAGPSLPCLGQGVGVGPAQAITGGQPDGERHPNVGLKVVNFGSENQVSVASGRVTVRPRRDVRQADPGRQPSARRVRPAASTSRPRRQ